MPPKPLVLVTHTLPESWIASLHDNCTVLMGPETRVTTGLSAELRQRLADADGLLSFLTVPIDDRLLDAAPRLRVISNMAVGVDNVDLDACTRRGIPVGHTPDVLTDATADMALALLLATARGLPQAARDAAEGRWGPWEPTRWLGADLAGATLGIVGMGEIGTAVARRARAFGMRIVYHNRSRRPGVAQELAADYVSLHELLRTSDVVSLNCPLTAETHHLIDTAALQAMKPSAILINTARGPVVDTAALTAALRDGTLRAAGLDVTDPEPLPPDHPLYALPNCVITPHIGSATERTRQAMAERACRNIVAGLRGERVPFCANRRVYGE
jgi:lactate dehydrogenase-like 2-hydroxyacid dehydrogenase